MKIIFLKCFECGAKVYFDSYHKRVDFFRNVAPLTRVEGALCVVEYGCLRCNKFTKHQRGQE